MSLDEFHFHLTEVGGKEAIWFEEFERDNLIVKPFIFDFKDKNDNGEAWHCDIPYTMKLGGLELAAKIREQLPLSIDLWYAAEFSKTLDKRPMLIY